jgi:hypothetical protein
MADQATPSGVPVSTIKEMQLGTSEPIRINVDATNAREDEVPLVKWTSTGSLLVEGSPDDPTSATVYANVAGLGTVRASVDYNGQHQEIVSDVMVIDQNVQYNKIEFA